MNIMIQEIGEIKYKDVKTYELWSYSEQLNSGVWSELDPRREDPVFSMFLGLNDRGGSQKVREDVWERITLWSGSENGWVKLGGAERMGDAVVRLLRRFQTHIHTRHMLYVPNALCTWRLQPSRERLSDQTCMCRQSTFPTISLCLGPQRSQLTL